MASARPSLSSEGASCIVMQANPPHRPTVLYSYSRPLSTVNVLLDSSPQGRFEQLQGCGQTVKAVLCIGHAQATLADPSSEAAFPNLKLSIQLIARLLLCANLSDFHQLCYFHA